MRAQVPAHADIYSVHLKASVVQLFQHSLGFTDIRVHAPITCIKLGIPIYFIDHSEFITVQCNPQIISRANNEIKCSEFSSIKRALRPHLRTIIAI